MQRLGAKLWPSECKFARNDGGNELRDLVWKSCSSRYLPPLHEPLEKMQSTESRRDSIKMRETMRERRRWEWFKSYTTMHTTEERMAGKSETKPKLGDWEWKSRKQSLLKGKKSHLLDESDSPLSFCSEMNNIPVSTLLLTCSKVWLSRVF